MQIVKDIDECLTLFKIGLEYYPNLKEIVEPTDINKWKKKLYAIDNYHEFLFGENVKLNLLNTPILVGLSIEKSKDDILFSHYRRLLNKVNSSLDNFPELKNDKSFKNKIKNLEQFNFLATLSELSLAEKFKALGYKIEFETKFKQLSNGKRKDVDLSISDFSGNTLHFEVYMPNKQIDINGFFDPNQDDSHFEYKVHQKLCDKFGNQGVDEINGTILLGVNKAFFDMIHMKSIMPFISNENLYSNLLNILPTDIKGLFVFEDGFGSNDSFIFEKMIIKN